MKRLAVFAGYGRRQAAPMARRRSRPEPGHGRGLRHQGQVHERLGHQLRRLEHIHDDDAALVVYCDVAIPGIGTAAGDKMLLPLSPLAGSGQ
jgi:hypothetical protein